MDKLPNYLPGRINTGSFLTTYCLNELEDRIRHQRMVLPICSLGTPPEQLGQMAPLVLPPLYHEALEGTLKTKIVERIRHCFPYYIGTEKRRKFSGEFEIVELPAAEHPAPVIPPNGILAFSVDTAVEEHGPHLPLATDTIQSYAVLQELARAESQLVLGAPVDYGHLVWGLAYGLSIDIPPPLLTRYVTGYVNALTRWAQPGAMYVVDVHGSPVHRAAIEEGLSQSECEHWKFRWLHQPLVEFAAERGDQHAGGVETALVHHIQPELVDGRWWPKRVDELADGQLSFATALELTNDLNAFIEHVEQRQLNGIVGNIRNFFEVNSRVMMDRMVGMATDDIQALLKSCS